MRKKEKKPFFASFLEKQLENPEGIQGGATKPMADIVTIPEKDSVTLPSVDGPVTLKYPSDSDEGGYDSLPPGTDPYAP